MVQPQHFWSGAGAAVGTTSASVQRKLRKMSQHPEDARVFSQAKILIPVGLLLSLIMTPTMYFPISEYMQGETDDIFRSSCRGWHRSWDICSWPTGCSGDLE